MKMAYFFLYLLADDYSMGYLVITFDHEQGRIRENWELL
jgi:hypothetical protein